MNKLYKIINSYQKANKALAENNIEEAKKIHEDSLRKVEEEKKQCDELSAQKAAMVNSLKKLTEATERLKEKMQG